jgi:hypothetical protein
VNGDKQSDADVPDFLAFVDRTLEEKGCRISGPLVYLPRAWRHSPRHPFPEQVAALPGCRLAGEPRSEYLQS